MEQEAGPRIAIIENGPYVLSGGVPLSEQAIGIDDAGNASSWVEGERLQAGDSYALCRCGQSKNKPYCDGTHAHVGFRAHDPQ
jgi:CDGSH-type Zn-finger protein